MCNFFIIYIFFMNLKMLIYLRGMKAFRKVGGEKELCSLRFTPSNAHSGKVVEELEEAGARSKGVYPGFP